MKQQKKEKSEKNRQREGEIKPESPLIKTLNQEQKLALTAMQEFRASEQSFFLLEGYAGTGKTTTIQAFIHDLQAKNQRILIACCAPTNKAVKVLQRTANKWGIHRIDFATVYQLLGLTLEFDDDGGKVLKEGKDSNLNKYDLIILDEASMVSRNLWELLQDAAPRRKTKIIMLGDPAQLPPVNEPSSVIFDENISRTKLTEVMRCAGSNPIIDLIDAAREKVFDPNKIINLESNFLADQSQGVWVFNRSMWLENMVKAFQSPRWQKDPDYVRAIAWTNRCVDGLNAYIRNALYETKEPFIVGERLIARDTIFNPFSEDEIIMPNSTECEVTNLRYGTDKEYNVWHLHVLDEEGNSHRLMVLDESSKPAFDATLKQLAHEAYIKKAMGEKKPWKDYWALRNRYAYVSYAYALTSHKSQGSTFTNVFVAQNDILRNPNLVEKYQSLYVAYSRASDRLIVNY